MTRPSTRRKTPHADAAPTERPQMVDIARIAGVSITTVSRALNGSSLVSADTAARIAEIARSMNYSIDFGAQNLRRRHNRTVAVVVPYDVQTRQHVSEPFFLAMVGSLADALTDRGYDVLLSRVDADRLDAVAHLHASGRAIGIVMIGQWHHHDQLNELAARRFPIVVWGAHLAQQLYCTVGGDNHAGGLLATRHLLETGRKRIAFFGDPTLPEVAQRFDGHRAALARAGRREDPALWIPCAFTAASGHAATLELCGSGVAFDAIFACSDLLALTAIGALRDHGLRVPDDVAVVGYDDIGIAQYANPPLTTVRQPLEAAGRALVESLLALVEGRRPTPTILPAELIVRGSSTPRASRRPQSAKRTR